MFTKLSTLSFLFSVLTTRTVLADGSVQTSDDTYTIELGAVGPLDTTICVDLKATAMSNFKEKHHTRHLAADNKTKPSTPPNNSTKPNPPPNNSTKPAPPPKNETKPAPPSNSTNGTGKP